MKTSFGSTGFTATVLPLLGGIGFAADRGQSQLRRTTLLRDAVLANRAVLLYPGERYESSAITEIAVR